MTHETREIVHKIHEKSVCITLDIRQQSTEIPEIRAAHKVSSTITPVCCLGRGSRLQERASGVWGMMELGALPELRKQNR